MGMTITEKILAHASQKQSVSRGEIVTAKIDLCMTNDATTHVSIDIFNKKLKNPNINNNNKTIFVIDHNVPSDSVKTTQVQNKMRSFAREHDIVIHDGDGICHQLLIEKYANPGDVIIAADSHTCSMGAIGAFGTGVGSSDFVSAMVTGSIWLKVPETIRINLKGSFSKGVYARDLILKIIGDISSDGATYMAMEFGGEAVSSLTIDDRIAITNLCVEAGAKNAIFEPDDKVLTFLKQMDRKNIDVNRFFKSDSDCTYVAEYSYNLSDIEPAITRPHYVDNYSVINEVVSENIEINQGFIGSCNNGRIEELRVAADILKRNIVSPKVKLLISPASTSIYLQAVKEGLIDVFLESGAIVLNPNCSVCWGACQGVLGDGEVLISTGTRNFKGRSGSKDSFVYLASAATVAASSLEGKIVDPRNYLDN